MNKKGFMLGLVFVIVFSLIIFVVITTVFTTSLTVNKDSNIQKNENAIDNNSKNIINDKEISYDFNNNDNNKSDKNEIIIIEDVNKTEPKSSSGNGGGGGGNSNNSQPNDNLSTPDNEPNVINNEISLQVNNITSSTISLDWSGVEDVTNTKIYLSSEPLNDNNNFDLNYLILNSNSNINSYTVVNLSSATNIFLKLEITANNEIYWGKAYAKTIGGINTILDNELREVSLFSPNILSITLENKNVIYDLSSNTFVNNLGAFWQSGNWQIRRSDNSLINIQNVYRRSIPVDLPDYELGYENWNYSDNNLILDHQLFFVLDEIIGQKEILFITGPNDLNFILPYSDYYLETPVIQLNQVSYSPRATMRYAYVSGWLGDGGSLSLNNFPNNAQVLQLPNNELDSRTSVLNNLSLNDRAYDSFESLNVKEINLSSLQESENSYKIRLPNIGVSWTTKVNENSVYQTYYTVARGLFFNRWAGDLQSQYTDWSRSKDHGIAYLAERADPTSYFDQSQPLTGQFNLVGGYHDAGDFDQRPMHTVIAQLLFRAYEINPELYLDNQLNIPESGNNIPDLLDSALWSIKGWEALQDPVDGGIRAGVESYAHPRGWYFADEDLLPYFTYSKNANVSARVSGVFAQASRLLQSFDSTRAATLRAKAISAYNYAKNNNAQDNFIIYGASELYKLTGESNYKNDFESYWNSIGPYGAFSNITERQLTSVNSYISGEEAMPDYILGYYNSLNPGASIIDAINTNMKNFADDKVDSIINSTHGHRSIVWGDLTWGNGSNMARFLDTVFAVLQLDRYANYTLLDDATRQEYFDALSLANDFMLGANPNGFVYITGLGERHPIDVLHLDSLAFRKTIGKPMPGIPVYGPGYISSVGYTLPARDSFYPSVDNTPDPLQYADVRSIVTNNEFDVWSMQAPLVEFFALLIDPNMTSNNLPSECNLDCYMGN